MEKTFVCIYYVRAHTYSHTCPYTITLTPNNTLHEHMCMMRWWGVVRVKLIKNTHLCDRILVEMRQPYRLVSARFNQRARIKTNRTRKLVAVIYSIRDQHGTFFFFSVPTLHLILAHIHSSARILTAFRQPINNNIATPPSISMINFTLEMDETFTFFVQNFCADDGNFTQNKHELSSPQLLRV